MKLALDPITEAATTAARGALPEFVTVGGATLLPRGADPFTGGEFPTLVAATRWVNVAPGGVLVGGSPATMATILGFDLPAVPEKPADGTERGPDDPPPPKWADLVAEAARPIVTTITQAIAASVAALAGLPPECSPTQVEFCTNDTQLRSEVGSVSDAVVILLSAEDKDVRLVVVVPGIFVARMRAAASNGGPQDDEAEGDDAETETGPQPFQRFPAEQLDAALGRVPMDLSIMLGSASVPLAQVLHLHEGEVLELQEGIDAPVELVSGTTPVARGDLEVGEAGNIVLHVTSIPGQPTAVFPRVMNARAGDAPGDPDAAPRADGDHESLAEAPGPTGVDDDVAGEPPADA